MPSHGWACRLGNAEAATLIRWRVTAPLALSSESGTTVTVTAKSDRRSAVAHHYDDRRDRDSRGHGEHPASCQNCAFALMEA